MCKVNRNSNRPKLNLRNRILRSVVGAPTNFQILTARVTKLREKSLVICLKNADSTPKKSWCMMRLLWCRTRYFWLFCFRGFRALIGKTDGRTTTSTVKKRPFCWKKSLFRRPRWICFLIDNGEKLRDVNCLPHRNLQMFFIEAPNWGGTLTLVYGIWGPNKSHT